MFFAEKKKHFKMFDVCNTIFRHVDIMALEFESFKTRIMKINFITEVGTIRVIGEMSY